MSTNARSAFVPNTAATVNLSATSTTGRVALVGIGPNVMLYNDGPNTVFVEQGDSTVTASATTGMPIPQGAWVMLGRVKAGTTAPSTHVAGICASAQTATLYATTGDGD